MNSKLPLGDYVVCLLPPGTRGPISEVTPGFGQSCTGWCPTITALTTGGFEECKLKQASKKI